MEPDGIKSVPFKVKAAGESDGLNEGQFEGYASVFGNVDSYGDAVQPGAFAKTLTEWSEKGDPIPLLWGHDFGDPFSNIGSIDSAEEDERGLKVVGTFDLENPKAAQVYKLAKGRRTTGMSFAYSVRDSEEKDGVTLLKDLQIFEASIVPLGANPLAGVEAVKSAAAGLIESVKAGRAISAKNEATIKAARTSLAEGIDALDDVLSVLGQDDDQEKQASDEAEAKSDASDEEPPAKSPAPDEEPEPKSSVARLAAQAQIYAFGQEGVSS